MYPLGPGITYPRNQWYVAAHGNEVNRNILERRILGTLMVMYRTEAGKAVILDGLCPHRLYPLAKSKLVGDSIECGYHGFNFDCTGKCTKIPGQNVPASFGTRSYPVIEKGPYVWVWPGDPALADEKLLPDYNTLGLSENFKIVTFGPLPLKARYQLLIENLYDLSHLNFIHGLTVSGGVLYETKAEMVQNGDYLKCSRVMRRSNVEHFHRFQFGEAAIKALPEEKLDIEILSEMYSPGFIATGSKGWQGGGYGDDSRYVGAVRFLHGITPETETTTHYFCGYSRDCAKDVPGYEEKMSGLDGKVRQEDNEALEAIESRITFDKDLSHEISAMADASALRTRRMIAHWVEAEKPRA